MFQFTLDISQKSSNRPATFSFFCFFLPDRSCSGSPLFFSAVKQRQAGYNHFTQLIYETPVYVRDHPRVCGEKGASARSWQAVQGSPPRMRGKGHILQVGVVGLGITPAYAGKSPPPGHEVQPVGDHPRVCGEK